MIQFRAQKLKHEIFLLHIYEYKISVKTQPLIIGPEDDSRESKHVAQRW